MRTLWVVGDSTLSSFEDKYFYPRYGYGTALSAYLDEEFVVENLALSGRSSKSYLEEPEYSTLRQGMKAGDFLLIGFGHNDEKGEKGRFTDANGDYKTAGSFAHSLYENYVKPAAEAGCRAIVATPIVRRTPTGNWRNQELHITENGGDFKGGDYAQAVRLFCETCKLPMVDMTAITKAFYEELGPEKTVFLHAWPSNNPISVDNTHTNIWGARVNAYFVMKSLKEQEIPGLSEHILGLEEDAPCPSKEAYLVANEAYVPTVFSEDLPDSKLWADYTDCQGNVFKGTVFGDVGMKADKFPEHFVLEPMTDGGLHIAVRDNAGKISAVSDGIAMYYRKVSVAKHFRIRAKVEVLDYFSNDQVSFGLMVRDDVYVDQETPDILGDYVAAAPLLLTRKDGALNCFARKSGLLVDGGKVSREYQVGETICLELASTGDGYAATFGEEKTVTGGFDFQLTAVDPKNVYVGMFVSRNAEVIFRDIEFEEF